MIRTMIRAGSLALALAGCAGPEVTSWTWTTSDDWVRDKRFLPGDSRWRGGDAIYSVPLSRDRILWLFGDSFIAAVMGGERAGSRMIRNSLALETSPGGSLDFFCQTGQDGQPRDALGGAPPGEWIWPLSGLRVGSSLHLFVYRVKARGEGAFGFSLASTALGTVDNPDESPDRWKISWVDVPLGYGSASLLLGGYAYVYGASETGERGLRLARTKAADLAAPDTWQYWTGHDWSPRQEDGVPLFDHAPIELSVAWLNSVHGFVAVSSAPDLSPEIQVRRSPHPEGPWSRPETIFRCPEAAWKKGYFCYAAKGHPELDPTGRTLTISYAVNSFSFADAVGDLRIYRPRFIVATPEPAESPRE